MDIRDIMDIPSRGKIICSINKKLQKKYSLACDAITTPTFGFREELYKKTNTSSPIFVLYNGFYENKKLKHNYTKNKKLTFCYTGTIHNDSCNLKVFCDAINDLIKTQEIEPQNIDIVYAGSNSGLFIEQTKSIANVVNIVDYGYLNYEEVFELQNKADVFLLMVMNQKKYTGVLTGKLSEGVCCGANLLGMVFGELGNSELYKTITENKLGFCYEQANSHSFEEMKKYIKKIYDKKILFKKRDISLEINSETRNKFDYEFITHELIKIIQGL